MEASASTVHCADVDDAKADNSAVGVSGHVKDDPGMAGSQPGQYNMWPPGGATKRAAILESVVRVLNRLVNLLANESSEEDQAADKDLPANRSVEADSAVVKNGEDI